MGTVTDVHPKRTARNNVKAMFEGGDSGGMVCTAEHYGADKAWVLLKPTICGILTPKRW